jgi:hypothetical protein
MLTDPILVSHAVSMETHQQINHLLQLAKLDILVHSLCLLQLNYINIFTYLER